MCKRDFFYSRLRDTHNSWCHQATLEWEDLTQWDFIKHLRILGVQESGVQVLTKLINENYELGVFVIPPNKLINKRLLFKQRAIALVDGKQFNKQAKKHRVVAEVWYGEDDHETMDITSIVKELWGKAHKRDGYNVLK